ncbi:heterokaryon incompatibility protein-domain-containing protein [Neurospora tetraspora]|uniref:Heterokaryon incompatibility protein-domain-containing protein n=1 Tax=Neurospora tetraspora TaxID=94610 RepID=A0AAE0MSV9_9PEZI|nr:heterokaryon incompatibility protein-domain-containing protein [Neurospora tetraspora]
MAEFQEKVRFIDIGLDDTATIRLVEGIKDTDVKYITLSYRWTAETPNTNLKTGIKDKYHKSISTENWPQIYNDVVALSRALGIRYVWIDSLCIIQDDGKDWNIQASLMHRIYAHGYLNLANACAEFSPGLEVTRDPLSVSPCVISRTRTDGSREYWACFRNFNPTEALSFAPLYSRGWCYQERFLATRTIQFSQQLYWECKAGHASESFTGEKGLAWSRDSASQHPDILTSVDQASDRRLSSALGASVERDWCVAGLWKKHLTRQLIWGRVSRRYGHYNEFEKIRDTAYYISLENQLDGFPSWSWASCPTSPDSSFITWPGYTGEGHYESLVEIETIIPLNYQALDLGYPGFESATMILRTPFDFLGFDAEQLLSKWESWYSSCNVDAREPNGDKCRFQVSIDLDRPILGVVKKEDLRLLPIIMEYQAGGWDTVRIQGILLETLGVEEGLPTFRRMGKWSHIYCARTHPSPIPGLLGYFDNEERLGIELGEFRKRRESLPFHRYKLV